MFEKISQWTLTVVVVVVGLFGFCTKLFWHKFHVLTAQGTLCVAKFALLLHVLTVYGVLTREKCYL
jgi:hypothetical protein